MRMHLGMAASTEVGDHLVRNLKISRVAAGGLQIES